MSNIIHTELRLHRPWTVFYLVSTFLSYLGCKECNFLPKSWAKILLYRSSVEKSESGAAWGCGPCQKRELPLWTGLCFCVSHHKRAICCSAWLETAPNEERKGAFLRQEGICLCRTTEEYRKYLIRKEFISKFLPNSQLFNSDTIGSANHGMFSIFCIPTLLYT